MGKAIHNDIVFTIKSSEEVIEALKDCKLDVGLIESYIYDDLIVYREWLDNELVVFSNTPIPILLLNSV